MGYEANEQPMISAYIYYYDKDVFLSLEFCKKIISALRKHGYGDITNIKLGKYRLKDGILEDYVVRYSKKDFSLCELKAEIFKWATDDEITYISFEHRKQRRWIWDMTWHKNYKMPDGVSVNDYAYNYWEIVSSYDRLENKDDQNAYIGLFCDLSDLFEAFYGRIEDISTAVELLSRTKENVFNHKHIQTVYWGNYLCNEYCLNVGYENFKNILSGIIRATEKGVFFAVTNDILDSKKNPDFRQRKKIFKYLKRQNNQGTVLNNQGTVL